MSSRYLAALAACGLLVGWAFADKKKLDQAPETGPEPHTVVAPPTIRAAEPLYFQTFVFPNELPYRFESIAPTCPKDCVDESLMVKTYAVADLVVPLPMAGVPTTTVPKTLEAALIQKITESVDPKSWRQAGGSNGIEYFPNGMALVVNATPKTHKALGEYLDALRKMQDGCVVTEIRLVTLSDNWFNKTGLAQVFALSKGESKPAAQFCGSAELNKLLQTAKADSAMNCLTSPQITCLNGQTGRVRCGETAYFLTGMTWASVNGQLVYTPKNEACELGVDMTVEPTISADGKSIKLTVNGSLREHGVLPVPATSVTTSLQATREDGKAAEPAPFTHLLQEPKIITRSVEDTVVVPDGGTVLLYGGKATIQETSKEEIKGLVDIPFLASVACTEKKVTKTNHLLVMVTTRVVRADAPTDEVIQTAGGTGKLPTLLAEYGRACREGRTEEARRLAMECLVIDPMCFAKK